MMWKLIATTLRQKRTAVVAYCAAGLALIWMYVAIYPSLQAQSASLNEVVKSLPPALLKAFGTDNLGLTNFEGLAGLKHYGFVWPLMMAFLAVSFGGTVLAGEIEKSTIGLWLAAPISRAKIYWSKYWAGVLAIAGFIIASVTAVLPVTALAHVDITAAHFLALSVSGGLFGLAIFSLTILVSSLASEKSRVYAVVGGGLLLMYVANVVAVISDKFSALKYVSLFHYFGAKQVLQGQPIDGWSYAVFGAVIVASAMLGAIIFKRRNIAV